MGAGASSTGKDRDLKGNQDDYQQKQPRPRNYVPICSPPHYDLTFDSTDSEITELEQERHRNIFASPSPAPEIQPIQPRRSSIKESIQEETREQGYEELSVSAEENPEEQRTLGRFEEEQTAIPDSIVESVEEEIRFVHLEEVPELSEEQEQEAEAETEQGPTVTQEESKPQEEESQQLVPLLVKPSRCSLKGICTRSDICRLKRCRRQVSFSENVTYCNNPSCPKNRLRQKFPLHENFDEYEDGYDYCYTEEEIDSTHDGFILCRHLNCLSESDEEEEREVMPDYQHYSREQPEKDPNGGSGKKASDSGNMRDCCRPCCPNRTASLKHNAHAQLNDNANACRCNQGERHTSESYVSCRAQSKNPSHSKSVPNQFEERDSYSNFAVVENQGPLPPRRSFSRPHPPPRKNKPRSYPPGHFEGRGNQERPHIPLPPPPQHFSEEQQPLIPPRQRHHPIRDPRSLRDSGEVRESRDLRGQRDSRESREQREPPQIEEHEDRKEMYSHNTNRNYATKKPYNTGYNRQALKPYPYEEPGSSSNSHDSTCSNNCSGYEHCPMHHACKCQCLCMNEEQRYCSQAHSDDQLSYCSDSSNSECMNLAYQRTGDYPELMDELENTLSHRNRMRVQKTMQRFEMLSRQNKNLDKPIFEDEESLRQYNMNMHRDMQNSMHRDKNDGHECKCRHCEEKLRRQNYNTRSETLAKRPNYQPTPFPRNSGYVEKIARYMDPNLNNMNNRREINSRKMKDDRHGMPTTVTNSNGTWQMDARKNEWVKVDNGHSGNNQYDFENSYPPLPPRPISEQMYDRRNYPQERGACSCAKCLRRR